MNFYTLAKRSIREIEKKIHPGTKHSNEYLIELMKAGKMTYAEAYAAAEQSVDAEFEQVARKSVQLMLTYKRIMEEEGAIAPGQGIGARQTFFITIRPDVTKTKFHDFYNMVAKYMQRKMFMEYKLSFEQKGTCLEDLGKGFHVHIIAQTTCRSKGEVLRNTISTFGGVAAANCIDVKICKSPEDNLKYLTDYASKDGHKIETKEWDSLWRKNECLEDLYTQLPIKSGMAAESSSTTIVF